MDFNIIDKSKPESKIVIWFRKTKDDFVEWWIGPWKLKDYLAIFGVVSLLVNVFTIIFGSIYAAKKKKR